MKTWQVAFAAVCTIAPVLRMTVCLGQEEGTPPSDQARFPSSPTESARGNGKLTMTPAPARGDAEKLKVFRFVLEDEKGEVSGVLIKPQGEGPFPAVVVNHGRGGDSRGFGTTYGTRFAQAGYVAIACDYTHGQVSRTRRPDASQRQRQNAQPQRSTGAIWDSEENQRRALACIRILQQQPEVDASKIAMYGNSMGAFLTIRMAQRTDGIRAAAITAGGLYPNPQNSPLTKDVDKIKIPFLILIGETDFVERGGAAKGLKAALDKNKTVADFHSFPGTGHNLIHEKTDDVYELMTAFLAKHLDKTAKRSESSNTTTQDDATQSSTAPASDWPAVRPAAKTNRVSAYERVNLNFMNSTPAIGEPLPDVSAFDENGDEFRLSDLKGHYTVLVFGCLT